MPLNPASDVATKLAAAGLGLTVGTNLFIGELRPVETGVPAKAAFVLGHGGPRPTPYLGIGKSYYRSHVQVLVRGNPGEFQVTDALARDVLRALHTKTITGYIQVLAEESEAGYLGADEAERPLFTVNAELHSEA